MERKSEKPKYVLHSFEPYQNNPSKPFIQGYLETLVSDKITEAKNRRKLDHRFRTPDMAARPKDIVSPPDKISDETWEKALNGDAKALHEVNTADPGCIYRYPFFLDELESKTLTAALSPNADEVKEAKSWLQKVCVPGGMQSGYFDLIPDHIAYLEPLLIDVTIARKTFFKLRRRYRNHCEVMRRLFLLFPELELAKQSKPNWLSLMFPKGKSEDGSKSVASKILAELLHMNDRELRRKLPHFFIRPPGDDGMNTGFSLSDRQKDDIKEQVALLFKQASR